MNILICNVGSTSLKYQLFDMDAGEKVLAAGGAERVGAAKSSFYHTNKLTGESFRQDAVFPTHGEAITAMLDALLNGGSRSFDAADWNVSGRAAGFDADDYEMDTDRYVPAPKRKSGCLTAFALIQALAVIGFVLWALRRML